MSNDDKKILQETSRWLRVGFLTLSVLGPVINTLSSRLRERAEVLREEASKHGNSLSEDLVNHSTKLSQVVATRSEKVGRDLAERSSKASQRVVDRSSDVLQELTERSEKASQELAKRGEQVSKEIAKRGAEVSKEMRKRSQRAAREMRKRSQKAQRELAKRTEQLTQLNSRQNSPFWPVFSFTLGLTAAGVAAFLLIRKRLQQNKQANQQAQLSLNGSLNGTSKNMTNGATHAVNQPSLATKPSETFPREVTAPAFTLAEPVTEVVTSDTPIVAEPKLEEDVPVTEKMPSVSIQAHSTETTPVMDATFLGIVSTKHYYPVETPLTELHSGTDEALDVVYFATADEAQAQGYTVAE
ncbi:MAG: hypothetical protein NVS4B1_28790 [Ktedonobacteraceae bacterium]